LGGQSAAFMFSHFKGVKQRGVLVKSTGFTLVELIVVILLIAILGATVLPKLQGTSEYTLVSQRDQFVSLLQTIQIRAMNNTQDAAKTCHRVLFLSNSAGLSAQSTTAPTIGGCGVGLFDPSNSPQLDFLIINDITTYTVTNGQNNTITTMDFDKWGRPTPDVGNCAGAGCKINIEGRSVCIGSQGYVRACS
jgi:MSHA pilin protein MshC